MGDLELRNPDFEITVNLNGNEKTIIVQPAETSDGIEYYKCNSTEQEITQLRQDEDGKWEQLWGTLSLPEIDAIGTVIAQKKALER